MSFVAVKDASDVARKVDTFQRTEGADTVETQAIAIVDPTTGSALVPVGGAMPVTGTFWQATQPVSVNALPLPSGAATSAAQATTNASLTSIDGKTPALVSGRQPVDGSGVTQPVSAAALPLPAGAATAAAQGTGNASLSSIDGKLPALVAGAVPTAVTAETSDYWPGYGAPTQTADRRIAVDDGGALITRGAVVTDEGTFRANFANASLAVSVGTVTLTNGDTAVAWTLTATTDLHKGDYIKLNADAEAAWAQIDSIDSTTGGTLVEPYSGTGGTGAASRALLRQTTGAGATVTVGSGQCTIAAGTTAAAVTRVRRVADYAPLVIRQRVSVSQRIANQTIFLGGSEDVAAPRWFARFAIDGTSNTTVRCQTGRNPTGAPSASETEETIVSLPNGATSATLLEYRIEQLTEVVRFYVSGVRVAEHSRVMPSQYDVMTAGVIVENGTTPASNTNVVIDYLTAKNHNKLEIGVMSDAEQIVATAAPMTPIAYNVAGVIPINTDLMVLDCRQLRSLSIHCRSMGTTGVVTVQWSGEPTFANPITATLLTEAGAIVTTFNAAGLRYANVIAPFCRLRLTTATTAGTTTIETWGSQSPVPVIVGTQPVSGTVTANQGTMAALPAGANAVGDVGVQVRANATGAATPVGINSLATTAATSIKAAAGRVLAVYLHNKSAGLRSVKMFNVLVGSVTMGTTAALYEIPIPAGGVAQLEVIAGNAHSAAIVYAVTSAVGVTDNTATGLAVGDVVGFVAFA